MHLAIERQGLRQVPTHCPERTSHIFDMNAGYLPDEPVAHQTWNLANQNTVLAIGPLTKHRIEAFRQFFEKARNVGGVVLQVAVQSDENVAGGPVDAGLQGGGLAEIAPQPNDLDPAVPRRQFFQAGMRSVNAAVVDKNDFIGQS